jgi:hypothetical protein
LKHLVGGLSTFALSVSLLTVSASADVLVCKAGMDDISMAPETYNSGNRFTLRLVGNIAYSLGKETRAQLKDSADLFEDEIHIAIPDKPTDKENPITFTFRMRDAKDTNFVRARVAFLGKDENSQPNKIAMSLAEREAADNDFSLSSGRLEIPMVKRGQSFELSTVSRRAYLYRYDLECERQK